MATDARIVVEKPFGTDLESARELNRIIQEVFDEVQVFRIDHYMGKETVQNILVLQFANLLFEPLWNRRYVDHVQLTVAEDIGIEGRGRFYERTGAIRDMVQAPVPGPDVPGHGAAGVVRPRVPAGREGEGASVDAPHPARGGGPRAVPRVPRRGRGGTRLRRRDVRGPPGGDRQLAVGRGPLLPADRQRRGRSRRPPWCSGGPPPDLRARGIGSLEPNRLRLRIQPDEGVSIEFTVQRPGLSIALDQASWISISEHLRQLWARGGVRDPAAADHARRPDPVHPPGDPGRAWEVLAPVRGAPPASYGPGTWGGRRRCADHPVGGRRGRRNRPVSAAGVRSGRAPHQGRADVRVRRRPIRSRPG